MTSTFVKKSFNVCISFYTKLSQKTSFFSKLIDFFLSTVVQESGVQGEQAHPQKFLFVENPCKIPENLAKIPRNMGKIREDPGKILENLNKLLKIREMAQNVVWLKKWHPTFCIKTHKIFFSGVHIKMRSLWPF